jgi:hypothetical protein
MDLYSQNQLQPGAPDSVQWCTGPCLVPQAGSASTRRSQEKRKATWLKFTGLSGEPTVPTPTVGGAISGRRVA